MLRNQPQIGCPRCDARHLGGTGIRAPSPPPLRLHRTPAAGSGHPTSTSPSPSAASSPRHRPGATAPPAAAAPPRLGRDLRRGPDRVPDLRPPVEPPATGASPWHLAPTHRSSSRDADRPVQRLPDLRRRLPRSRHPGRRPRLRPWRRLAARRPADQRRHSSPRSGAASAPRYQPGDTGDPIAHWMNWDALSTADQDRRGPTPTPEPAAPAPSSRPGKANQARHERSSYWFARRPNGGNVILHHCHVRPVLSQLWSPTMERIEGAIWASADLTTQPQDLISPNAPLDPNKSAGGSSRSTGAPQLLATPLRHLDPNRTHAFHLPARARPAGPATPTTGRVVASSASDRPLRGAGRRGAFGVANAMAQAPPLPPGAAASPVLPCTHGLEHHHDAPRMCCFSVRGRLPRMIDRRLVQPGRRLLDRS